MLVTIKTGLSSIAFQKSMEVYSPYCLEKFAVTPRVGGKPGAWEVTHLGSGLKLNDPRNRDDLNLSLADAAIVAQALNDDPIFWDADIAYDGSDRHQERRDKAMRLLAPYLNPSPPDEIA